jgi:hypothetical protein
LLRDFLSRFLITVLNMTDVPRPRGAAEARQAPRQRTFLGGRVILRDCSAAINCMIRSRSRTGARIEIAASQPVPKRFYLLVSREKLVYDAELAWREGNLAGLKLIELINFADSTDPHHQLLGEVVRKEQ